MLLCCLQVTDIMRTGPMNTERASYIEEARLKLGVDKEVAERIVKATRSEVRATAGACERGHVGKDGGGTAMCWQINWDHVLRGEGHCWFL